MLLLVIETTVQDTWPNLRRELERMHLGEFRSDSGRVLQRTETTPRQREILNLLEIAEPKLVLGVTPGQRRLSRSV
jgi:hypothetical protein